MKITEEWLKKQGWEVNHYDLPVKLDISQYATKMFGKDKVFWNDRKELKIFRDYKEPCDVYADVLIDNVDTVEKLYQSLDLCGLYDFKEYDWLYETWLDKACEFLNERLYPTVKVLNEDLVDVIDRWELIDEFREAMGAVIKENLNPEL